MRWVALLVAGMALGEAGHGNTDMTLAFGVTAIVIALLAVVYAVEGRR